MELAIQQHINNFLTYMENHKKLSWNTIRVYKIACKRFNAFLTSKSIYDLKLVTNEIAGEFLVEIGGDISSSSLNNKISALKQFFKYLENNEIVEHSPFESVESAKTKSRIPKALTGKEIEALRNTPIIKKNNRNQCILELMLQCGLRISEVTSIKRNDINFEDYSLRIVGKGNKERILYFKENLSFMLNELVSDKITEDSNIFDIGVQSINYTIKKAFIQCNIEKKGYTVHSLRHTFATNMLNETGNIRVIQEILGHSYIGTTQIYTHVSNEQIKEAMRGVKNDIYK